MSDTMKAINYADLELFLIELGFKVKSEHEHYVLFEYVSPDVLIVLPSRPSGDVVDAAHLTAVRKHILDSGLLDTSSFEALLYGPKTVVSLS